MSFMNSAVGSNSPTVCELDVLSVRPKVTSLSKLYLTAYRM